MPSWTRSRATSPSTRKDGKLSLAVNGEIYNYKALREEVNDESRFKTNSDCEPIVHLYEQVGDEIASRLDGDFAFVILNEETGAIYAARDPVGVNSLYWGTGLDGSTWFASEAKPLVNAGCIDVAMFPPGHYYTSERAKGLADGGRRTGDLVRYYNPLWFDSAHATKGIDLAYLRETFVNAVDKRMMADVPYGVLLSGGLDSSLVASVICRLKRQRYLQMGPHRVPIAQCVHSQHSMPLTPVHCVCVSYRYLQMGKVCICAPRAHTHTECAHHRPVCTDSQHSPNATNSFFQVEDLAPVKSFSIGLEGSPDLKAAQVRASLARWLCARLC